MPPSNRVVIIRMRGHQPTLDYVPPTHLRENGKSKSEIIRCLKSYVPLVRSLGISCTKPALADAAASSS